QASTKYCFTSPYHLSSGIVHPSIHFIFLPHYTLTPLVRIAKAMELRSVRDRREPDCDLEVATMHFRMRTALAAGVTAAAMTLAACSGPGSGDEPSEEFTYWSMWKEGEPQQKVMAQAIEDFEAETGITVDVQWQGR